MEIIHDRTMSEKRLDICRFTKLFEDAKRRQALDEKRRDAISDIECTFNPNTDLTNDFNANEIINRQPLYQNSARKKERSKNGTSEFDPKTGRPLYRPHTGRAPRNRPKSRTESISDYLYNLSKVSNSRIEDNGNCASAIQTKSNNIVKKVRNDAFSMVFRILDSDGDGMISSESIEVGKIPKEIAKIFIPILSEMEDMKCTLNLEEFIDASNNLFKELTIIQKNEFINYYKSQTSVKKNIKEINYEKCSFKVFIISS